MKQPSSKFSLSNGGNKRWFAVFLTDLDQAKLVLRFLADAIGDALLYAWRRYGAAAYSRAAQRTTPTVIMLLAVKR